VLRLLLSVRLPIWPCLPICPCNLPLCFSLWSGVFPLCNVLHSYFDTYNTPTGSCQGLTQPSDVATRFKRGNATRPTHFALPLAASERTRPNIQFGSPHTWTNRLAHMSGSCHTHKIWCHAQKNMISHAQNIMQCTGAHGISEHPYVMGHSASSLDGSSHTHTRVTSRARTGHSTHRGGDEAQRMGVIKWARVPCSCVCARVHMSKETYIYQKRPTYTSNRCASSSQRMGPWGMGWLRLVRSLKW